MHMLYQTQQSDVESGLYYLRARYYDPLTGTFLSRDPIKGTLTNPQTQNPYAYALNNPVNLGDPSGEQVAVLANPYVLAGACAIGVYLYATNPVVKEAVNDTVSTLYSSAKDTIYGETSRNPKQDKKLTDEEIRRLEQGSGEDVHDIKGKGGGKYDLFKDKDGNIYQKPKSGEGPGDPTGHNINDY